MISLTDPGVLREVYGSSLYLTVVVIIGLALGALFRKTAAGLSVFAAVFFVIPVFGGPSRRTSGASRPTCRCSARPPPSPAAAGTGSRTA